MNNPYPTDSQTHHLTGSKSFYQETAKHRQHRLRVLADAVATTNDAAALVEAVRHCHEERESVPGWVVQGLERLLVEFVAPLSPPRARPKITQPRFGSWGRQYVKALRDWVIAGHVEEGRRHGGLTWEETLDEAACYFRGTAMAGSPDALKKACQRAKKKARAGWFQRMPTHWEGAQFRTLPSENLAGPSNYWLLINGDRQGDTRGEWRERPRLLSHLSLHELECEAQHLLDSLRGRGQKRR
jgi:hypothetical protein